MNFPAMVCICIELRLSNRAGQYRAGRILDRSATFDASFCGTVSVQ